MIPTTLTAAANQRPAAYRGTATFSGQKTAGTPTTQTAPPAGRVGDLLLAAVYVVQGDTIAAPTGWTLVPMTSGLNPAQTGTAPVSLTYLYQRVADGTADDNPTWTKTGTTSNWRVLMSRWRGSVAGAVSTGRNYSGESNSGTVPRFPAIDVGTDYAGIGYIIGNSAAANSSGHNARIPRITRHDYFHVYYRTATGAVPDFTVTLNAAANWCTFAVALSL